MSDQDRSNKPTMGGHEIRIGPRDDDEYDETTRRMAYTPAFNPSVRSAAPPIQAKAAPVVAPSGPRIVPYIAKPQPHPEIYRWRLAEIPTLAEYHRVERTAVFCPHAASNPSQVTGRISDVLRDRSIEAEYDNEKAKVKCMTPDGVDFRVRLYRGRGDYSHGIIVEVQRRFGTSISFHGETRAILDAAQGRVSAVPPPPALSSAGNTAPLPMVTDEDMEDYEDGMAPPPPNGASSLQMVNKMLQHGSPDAFALGCSTLLSLTSVDKMGLSTARAVSQELLRPGNETGSRLFALMQEQQQDAEDVFHVRVMALTVLANALEATRGNVSDQVADSILPVLIKELLGADHSPRSAQIAAKAASHLRESGSSSDLRSALMTAVAAGEMRSIGLRNQAQCALDTMS